MSGPMFIIGGHEDKDGRREILSSIAQALPRPKLVLATIASRHPEGYLEAYRDAFSGLGDVELVELEVDVEAEDADLSALEGAGGIFLSGGDQRLIIEKMAGTELEDRVRQLWSDGGVIAGTSAGASAVGESMIERGSGDETYRLGEITLGQGLGLVTGVIIDQHFAERGRIGRLLGAVAESPVTLGIGIDENTAVRLEQDHLAVIGDGSVYVVDGRESAHTNVTSGDSGDALSLHDVRLHVLSRVDTFDLSTRRPAHPA